jgi:glycosyltransferase involved in cell wall biosynthesis
MNFADPISPLITIAMPVRNGERYIRTAIDSILYQSFSAVQLLISDNVSTDATPSIIQEYQQRNDLSTKQIIYVRQSKDIGLIPNLEFCIKYAQTPYVTFMPHDDFFASPLALECAFNILEQSLDIAAVYSDMNYVDSNGNTIATRRFGRSGDFDSFIALKRSIVTTRNMFGIPVLMRTELIRNVSFDDRFTYIGDVDFSYASSQGKKIYYFSESLIANRFHQTNATRNIMTQAHEQFQMLADKYSIQLSFGEKVQNVFYRYLVLLQKHLFFRLLDFRFWYYRRQT